MKPNQDSSDRCDRIRLPPPMKLALGPNTL
jgi:hypothetical protein